MLRMMTRKYIFSALTTLSCAALAAPHSILLAAALAVSAIGDYFMCHRNGRDEVYRLGIAGFFLGHVLFIAFALSRARFSIPPLIIGVALAAFYALYLAKRILPKVPELLRLPSALYAIISVVGFTCALMTGDAVYIVGIFMLLFSDTMIAEHDFVGNQPAGILVLPTYYLCHILVTLSAMI